MSKKQKRNLEVVSKIDGEIVEKATQERSNLLLALKRRIKKMWLIRGGAMAASLLLIAATVLVYVVVFAKEVPVYTGMTVSNTAPTTVASVTLPGYLDPGNGNGNAYGNKHLNGDHTDADKTIGDKPFETSIGDAVGALHVQSTEPRYYAKPNEDVYITVHIENPDDFVILSFTLNGQMYSSYMFEQGSDLENLILKVNVGDVEGMVSYTIDAIKYVDGTKIKDVKIGGERTVEIGVYTEKQPAAAFSDLVLGFNSISFAVDVSDTKNLFETLTGNVEAVLYDGTQIVARKSISATGKTTVTFDGLTTGALYECAVIATYDALDGEGIARHILSTHAAYTKSIVLFDAVEIGTTTLSFEFLWDQALAAKTVTGLALYQNDTKVRDIDASATTVEGLVPGATYTLVATYQNGSADEQISITFTTDALFVTVNQYLEELDGSYTLVDTVTEKVVQGTVYTPVLGSREGFTTPTVAPVTVTDRSHVFECYFERTAYEVTFHYNSAQGIVTERIKVGNPLAPTVAPTRDGFTFGGWYLNDRFTAPASDTVPTGRYFVYAKWLTEASPADFIYQTNDDKVTIKGFFPGVDFTDLVIPAYIGGYPVTAIAWNGKYVDDELTEKIVSVTIPDTVTTVGDYAFSGWQLSSITIPDSITTIGAYAFENCTDLSSITIPASVTAIGNGAFSGCTGIESIGVENGNTTYHSKGNCLIETVSKTLILGCNSSIIPTDSSVTAIGAYAFSGCTGLADIEIPDSVISIGTYAFSGCTGIVSITVPDSVTTIGERAFGGCNRLERITLPFVGEKSDGTGYTRFSGIFDGIAPASLKTVVITGGESIDDHAFQVCSNLVSIEILDGVTTIGEWAFSECTSLASITLPDSVTTIGYYAFSGCTALSSITLPFVGASLNGTEHAYFSYIFGGIVPTSLTTVVITGGESIGDGAFQSCPSLVSITLPDSVTTIGAYAFSGCTALSSISFGANSQLESIGFVAFGGCTSLASITIPASVTAIDPCAFENCTALSSVIFERTSGWDTSGGPVFSATDLENTSTAAKYLTNTYCYYYWQRS